MDSTSHEIKCTIRPALQIDHSYGRNFACIDEGEAADAAKPDDEVPLNGPIPAIHGGVALVGIDRPYQTGDVL